MMDEGELYFLEKDHTRRHRDAKQLTDLHFHSAFSVSKHWLLTGEGRMFNSTPEEKMEQMTTLFNELYPEFQDFVLRQIDELIELQNVRQ
ncbi:MAG: hypothetical protein LBH44_14300 [Treponema sp.]|jgi:hypothetical protein|nr:hypothetical protein [Treponema sp.]